MSDWRQWVLDRIDDQGDWPEYNYEEGETPLESLRSALGTANGEGFLEDRPEAIFRGVAPDGERFVFGWIDVGDCYPRTFVIMGEPETAHED